MPNYFRNRLTVLHDSTERVEEVLSSIRSEERNVIDFNCIIPRPEALNGDHDTQGEYAAKYLIEQAFPMSLCEFDRMIAKGHVELKEDVRKRAEAVGRQMLRNIADYGYASFLQWSIANWGTKWNSIGDKQEMRREGNTIYFETANNYCKPVIEAISRKFPDVGFEYAAADEDKGSNTIKGIFLRGKFEGVEEHRTPLAFDICWELFPEDKEEYYQLLDGTWTVKED